MFTLIKKYKNITVLLILLVVTVIAFYQANVIKEISKDYEVAIANTKAAYNENQVLQDEALVYLLRIDQFDYFKDSINTKFAEFIKEDKINKKKIKQLLYLNTITSKKDTILFNDTIFREDIKLDTMLIHPGYTLQLKLEYPNKIETTPTFINEIITVFSHTRETVEPPKRFFLLRWFLKKHTIVTVDVKDTNPYSTMRTKRFIEIIN